MPKTSESIVKWAETQASAAHTPKYKRLSHDQQIAALKLSKLGRTQAQIAEVLGCHQTSVSRWLTACDDTSQEAIAYARGQSLPMMRRIVEEGRPADLIAVQKGLGNLEDKQVQGLSIQIGGNLNVLLSPLALAPASETA